MECPASLPTERKYHKLPTLMTGPEFPIVVTAVPVWSKVVGPAAPMLYGIIFGGKESRYWRKGEGAEAGKCMLPCRTARYCM